MHLSITLIDYVSSSRFTADLVQRKREKPIIVRLQCSIYRSGCICTNYMHYLATVGRTLTTLIVLAF